ncbi:MAG: nitroreductase family deazaflavin-dependent oxidoreductase [Anaerolineae bacterium]|nr:nitroreductase family deazaflavin-dependent oxidoreductase [Anaerolineae bacterium]
MYTTTTLSDKIKDALSKDKLIDIITTGAKTGLPRKTEIWFTNIGGRIIICGTPAAKGGNGPRARRDWLANLSIHPEFIFCLKESLNVQLPARAVIIVDPEDRRRLMTAPETQWYREQVDSIEDLVENSPIIEVFFDEHNL